MNDEKKMKDKENKSVVPGGNKSEVSEVPEVSEVSEAPEVPEGAEVRIKFRANRAAEGVAMDADGVAIVSKELAQYLVSIGYAEEVNPPVA